MFNGTKSLLFVRLMRLFHAGTAGTKYQLAEAAFSTPRNIESYIWLLKSVGLCRVVDWQILTGRGAPRIAVYGWGGGEPDVPRPARPEGLRFDVRHSELAARIRDVLAESGVMSIAEVAASAGIREEHARGVLASMRDQGMAHIAKWKRIGAAHPTRYYAAGNGVDAPKPKKRTNAQALASRRRMLVEKFGDARAKSILASRRQGGVDRVVVDGKVAYQRREPRGGRPAKA